MLVLFNRKSRDMCRNLRGGKPRGAKARVFSGFGTVPLRLCPVPSAALREPGLS
jgi:hypothetical protein